MEAILTLQVEQLIKTALEEDICAGDITTLNTVPSELQGKGIFRAKRDCVVAGLFLLDKLFSFLEPEVRVKCLCCDGDQISRGTSDNRCIDSLLRGRVPEEKVF